METSERIEIGLIVLLAAAIWFAAPAMPAQIGLGKLLLWSSGLLLLQSLVRDLWLLAKARRNIREKPQTAIRCMCVESTVGMTGIVIGRDFIWRGIRAAVVDGPVAVESGCVARAGGRVSDQGLFGGNETVANSPAQKPYEYRGQVAMKWRLWNIGSAIIDRCYRGTASGVRLVKRQDSVYPTLRASCMASVKFMPTSHGACASEPKVMATPFSFAICKISGLG